MVKESRLELFFEILYLKCNCWLRQIQNLWRFSKAFHLSTGMKNLETEIHLADPRFIAIKASIPLYVKSELLSNQFDVEFPQLLKLRYTCSTE